MELIPLSKLPSQCRAKYKTSAGRKVLAAIKSGELVRRSCEVCGKVKAQAHHEDYAKPLEVTWLCSYCHFQRHKQINRERYAWLKAMSRGDNVSMKIQL